MVGASLRRGKANVVDVGLVQHAIGIAPCEDLERRLALGGDDEHVVSRGEFRFACRWHGWQPRRLLQDRVRVRAAKAEGADAGETRYSTARPFCLLRGNVKT